MAERKKPKSHVTKTSADLSVAVVRSKTYCEHGSHSPGDDEQYSHYHADASTRKKQIWVRFSSSTVELRPFPFKVVIINSNFF